MLWCLLGLPDAAAAQLAASLSATSDYRLRGLSLNGGRPALTAAVAYDHASGVYAGASVTGGDTRSFGAQLLSHAEFLGYAARFETGTAWDVGVSNTQVFSNVYRRFSGNYVEFYGGLSSERFSARVYFSPAYFNARQQTVYVDLNATMRAARRLRVFGHGGVLVPVAGAGAAVPRARYDLRFGGVAEFGRGEVQLAWIRSGADADYLSERRQARDALVIGASWFF